MCPSIICAVVNHVALARMTKVQEENWVAVIHYMGTIKKVVQLDFMVIKTKIEKLIPNLQSVFFPSMFFLHSSPSR